MTVRMLAALLATALPMSAAPAAEDVVPSCYLRTGIGVAAAAPPRAAFVVLDQTTSMPAELGAMLHREAARAVVPGTRFTVASFSATQGGNFARIAASGTLEAPVPAAFRNGLSVPRLRNLDQCLVAQGDFARRKLDGAIEQAAPPMRARFDHSEILRALRDLSTRIATTPARERIVVIYSDMIEHSDIMTFYADRRLRVIDPRAELRTALSHGLRGNFGGARVYVIGGALSESNALVESQARDNLRAFWAAWFRQSNARLMEFGSPGLINPVR